jgi:hypothetical protein
MFGDLDLEVALLAADTVYFGKRDEVDVGMPADLDQLGGDDSHGTFVGRKGLVKLCHNPANTGRPFHQVHIKT